MNELQKALNNFSQQLSDDIISGFERRIGFQDKLLKQAIAFREECVAKGLVTLIPDQDKKIENLRESIAKLNEEMVQAIESL